MDSEDVHVEDSDEGQDQYLVVDGLAYSGFPMEFQVGDDNMVYSFDPAVYNLTATEYDGESPYLTGEIKQEWSDFQQYPGVVRTNVSKRKPFIEGERPYSCDQCDYKAISQSILTGHQRTHTGEKPFQCDLCNYRARLKPDLVKHKRTHSDEKPYRCKYCSHSSKHLSNLKIHLRTHSEERPFHCPHCGFTSTTKAGLVKHSHTHAGDRERLHQCSECSYRASTSAALASHERQHQVLRTFQCSMCSVALSTQKALQIHVEQHIQNTSLVCPLCQYRTKNPAAFQRHILKHQAPPTTHSPTLECDQCDFVTSDSSRLLAHQHAHRGENEFSCEMCEYSTNKRFNYKRHLFKHTGEKPLQCEYCDYRVLELSSLNRHVRLKHPDARMEICSRCPFQTPIRRYMENHLRTHLKKPLQCDQCQYRCNGRSDLNKHAKTHAAKKAYPCDQCNFSTSSKAALTKHAINHPQLRCTFAGCNFRSSQAVDFHQHISSHANALRLDQHHIELVSHSA